MYGRCGPWPAASPPSSSAGWAAPAAAAATRRNAAPARTAASQLPAAGAALGSLEEAGRKVTWNLGRPRRSTVEAVSEGCAHGRGQQEP